MTICLWQQQQQNIGKSSSSVISNYSYNLYCRINWILPMKLCLKLQQQQNIGNSSSSVKQKWDSVYLWAKFYTIQKDLSLIATKTERKLLAITLAQLCQTKVTFCILLSRDEDPDPVGSGDFWPAGSGSGTFFNGSGSGSYL